MSINIILNKDNKLLGRKDIEAEVEFKGPTPSKKEIKKMIISKSGGDEKLVAITVIKNYYGEQKAFIKASVYNSLEDMKKLEKVEEEKKEESADSDKESTEENKDESAEGKKEEEKAEKEEKKIEEKPTEEKKEGNK